MSYDEVACPKCGGKTWDNRVSKKNPKAPDFKCRDKSCDGAVWPPKNGAPVPQQAPQSTAHNYATSPNAPAGFAAALGDQEADERQFVNAVTLNDRLQPLFALYSACLNNAVSEAMTLQLPLEVIPQMAATLFIAAKDRMRAA